MNKSISKTRFNIYANALIPFIILVVSGIALLKYHSGATPETRVMGLNADFWFSIHKITSIISIVLILLHLFVKTDWVKRLFTFKPKRTFRTANIILFIIFILCSLTTLLAWVVFEGTSTAKNLYGIHNKLGLLLIVMFLIHLWNYRKVLVKQFKKIMTR